MPGTDTVAAAYVQPLLEAAGAHGIDSATLASAAGLPENGLSPLPATLPATAYVRLLDAGAMLAGDAHFGLHVGERVRMGTYSAYGLVLLSCASVGPRIGPRTAGVKRMPRSGVSPRAKTSPRPDPTEVKTSAPGMMPRTVVTP